MTANSILLALDGSAEARFAAQAAWLIAEATGAQVHAEHVVDTESLWRLLLHHKSGFIGSGPYFEGFDAAAPSLRKIGNILIEAYETFVPDKITSTASLSEGSTVKCLLDALANRDVLVVGHRRTVARRDEHRRVSTELARLSPKPVLLVQDAPVRWSSIRLLLTNAKFNMSFIPAYLEFADALNLRLEICHLPDADEETSRRITAKLQEYAGNMKKPVFVHSVVSDKDNATYIGAVSNTTLTVVPKVMVDDSTVTDDAANDALYSLLEQFDAASLLLWPVESLSKGIETKTLAKRA